MFAYHSGDPVSATEMKHHEFRGVKNILLLNSMDKRNISETGWKKFDLTARNVSKKFKEPYIIYFQIPFYDQKMKKNHFLGL